MNFFKNVLIIVGLACVVSLYSEVKKKPSDKKVVVKKETIKKESKIKQPSKVDVNKPKLSMSDYIVQKVAEYQKDLVSDLFLKKNAVERVLLDFKAEFPGPNKEGDTTLIYNAIINNPEIKKRITLENAVPLYRFLKEHINNIWQKQDDEIWSR